MNSISDNIFSSWPNFSEEEAFAVQRVLLSNKVNYWTGDECREFEKEFAAWVESKHAISLANGTVALDLALKALGVSVGDEVVVTPRSFIASVSSVVNAGATPIFADVDLDSGNITADSIQKVITKKTKAVICVHLGGYPCDMDPIMNLAKSHNFKVIEDCAQAHGARYKGRSVGSIGHISAWSFCQDKIMTTGGEGGMVTTNDEDLWRFMWAYKDHGKSYDAVYHRTHPNGFRWLHESFGTNWRMLEMQAVIGRIQLRKMPHWHQVRLKNTEKIWNVAREFDSLRVGNIPSEFEHGAYKCYVYVQPKNLKEGWTRDMIIDEIIARGVPCFSGSCSEIYKEKAFDGTGFRPLSPLNNTMQLGATSIMFMVHPTLSVDAIKKTCDVLKEVMIISSLNKEKS
jgi:dTDP-4-amino-4,6-dideoxygalactose transaminase